MNFKNWKKWVVFKPIVDFYNMMFVNDVGASLRKVGFVFSLFCAMDLQKSILDDNIKQIVISHWQIFGAVCIGLVTIPELIKFLNKDTTTSKITTTEEVNIETKS